jgi:hypothetical protein
MIECSDLKKCVQFFYVIQKKLFIFGIVMSVKKKQLFKKLHNVLCNLDWLWERSSTLDMESCMVMGEDHHIVMHIFENKYGGNEPFKGRFN